MMPLKEWLNPPRNRLLILFLLTLVSVSAVAWFGWELLGQERMVVAQRAQDRLEQSADRIAATLRGSLAETGECLSAWLDNPPAAGKPDDGLLLIVTESPSAIREYPRARAGAVSARCPIFPLSELPVSERYELSPLAQPASTANPGTIQWVFPIDACPSESPSWRTRTSWPRSSITI